MEINGDYAYIVPKPKNPPLKVVFDNVEIEEENGELYIVEKFTFMTRKENREDE